jgi:murein hydrolase activator
MRAFIFTFFLSYSTLIYAQSSADRGKLEAEKKKNLQKIEKVNKILNQTEKEKKTSLGKIKDFEQQILNQESKVEIANKDLVLTDNELRGIQNSQKELYLRIKKLQKDYAEIVYNESKNAKKLNTMNFLFSAGSLSEVFIRYKYLQQYSDAKKNQLREIKELVGQLKDKNANLVSQKQKQNLLLRELNSETKNLEDLKDGQEELVKELAGKEAELKKELDKSKRSLRDLESLISKVISKSAGTTRGRSKRAPEAEPQRRVISKAGTAKVPENKIEEPISIKNVSGGDFSKYKKRLDWPTDGYISDRFGVKNHPVLKGVKVVNNGVDIRTSNNASIRSVFEGEVLDISQIPGLNFVVAVQHGEYYTVYANLSNVNVKVGQRLGIGQTLGNAARKDGSSEINFQIWHNFDKLNPEAWLLNK